MSIADHQNLADQRFAAIARSLVDEFPRTTTQVPSQGVPVTGIVPARVHHPGLAELRARLRTSVIRADAMVRRLAK